MLKSKIAETVEYFKSDINTVWSAVTDNEDYKWRSDIKRIEASEDGTEWLEYYGDKRYTKFVLIEKKECSKYAFNMENTIFKGRWQGCFYSTEAGGTRVVFTENIFVKDPIMRMISYAFWDLKKVQQTYISDLKARLHEI